VLLVLRLVFKRIINQMKMIIIILSVLSLAMFSCIALTDNKQVTLGKNTFCIPKKYNILDQTTGPVINIPGADTGSYGGSFQLSVDAPEVKESIAEYSTRHGSLYAALIVNVRQASAEQLERRLNNNRYAEVLQLTRGVANDYEHAYVHYDEKHQFYHVNSWGESPPPFILWEVLKIKPHKKAIIPGNLNDYHVASCSGLGGIDGYHDEVGTSCDYSLKIDGYLVRLHTTGNNLHLKEKITAFVKNQLVLWRENCE